MSDPDARVVYLVDDDASLRRSFRNLMCSVGFTVQTFESAEAFLESGAQNDAACLVLDLRLDRMSGLELLEHLAAIGSRTRAVVLTGHGDDEAMRQSLELGAVSFLTKPFRAQDLLAAVKAATDKDRVSASARLHELPTRTFRMVGRSETVAALAAKLQEQRLLTVVGPGGIGKTTVALAVAGAVLESYEQGARYVDLSPITDGRLVPKVLASVLGLSLPSERDDSSALEELKRFLAETRMLILVDGCERVSRAGAALVEVLLAAAPGVHFLATSREPLQARGEFVHRLASLGTPPQSSILSAAQALRFPSVELFVERARAGAQEFELSDADAPFVSEMCRQLGGIPLAIELASSRVEFLGVRGLVARLDDRFGPLAGGRHTTVSRHQTLRATLDWSHDLLSAAERAVLRRLSIFSGSFTLESAAAVAGGDCDVPECVLALVTKSLVAADVSGDAVYYRLLDMTRAYALEKLAESGELPALRQRHAEHLRDVFAASDAQRLVLSNARWLSIYARLMGDVRAALDWSFSPDGDVSIGRALTATSAATAIRLSDSHFAGYLELALESLAQSLIPDPRLEMDLSVALSKFVDEPRRIATLRRVLELSEQLGSSVDQALALEIAWTLAYRSADYQTADKFARMHGVLVSHSTLDHVALNHDRIMIHSLLYNGDLATARHLAERNLEHPETIAGIFNHPFAVDARVLVRALLARIYWLLGLADQGLRLAEAATELAVAMENPEALAHTLGIARCPLAFWSGDGFGAERATQWLLEHTARYSFSYWRSWGLCYQAAQAGSSATEFTLTALEELPFDTKQLDVLGTFREDLAVPTAIARAEGGKVGWCAAELVRAKGVGLLKQGGPEAESLAENAFLRALSIAQAQKALAWELRAATSLALLWQRKARTAQARELLGTVLSRFSEGFATVDFIKARSLLHELGGKLPSLQ